MASSNGSGPAPSPLQTYRDVALHLADLRDNLQPLLDETVDRQPEGSLDRSIAEAQRDGLRRALNDAAQRLHTLATLR